MTFEAGLDRGLPQSDPEMLPAPSECTRQNLPCIKLKIKRVYKKVPYQIEADINDVESAEQIVSLMRQAEQFIDRMQKQEPELPTFIAKIIQGRIIIPENYLKILELRDGGLIQVKIITVVARNRGKGFG